VTLKLTPKQLSFLSAEQKHLFFAAPSGPSASMHEALQTALYDLALSREECEALLSGDGPVEDTGDEVKQ